MAKPLLNAPWPVVVLGVLGAIALPIASTFARRAQSPPTAACSSTPPATTTTVDSDSRNSGAYAQWERAIPDGSKLCRLKLALDKQSDVLPAGDLEDRSPLPKWFRVLMRKQHPELAASGRYQYPREANRALQRLLDNPDSPEVEQLLDRYAR